MRTSVTLCGLVGIGFTALAAFPSFSRNPNPDVPSYVRFTHNANTVDHGHASPCDNFKVLTEGNLGYQGARPTSASTGEAFLEPYDGELVVKYRVVNPPLGSPDMAFYAEDFVHTGKRYSSTGSNLNDISMHFPFNHPASSPNPVQTGGGAAWGSALRDSVDEDFERVKLELVSAGPLDVTTPDSVTANFLIQDFEECSSVFTYCAATEGCDPATQPGAVGPGPWVQIVPPTYLFDQCVPCAASDVVAETKNYEKVSLKLHDNNDVRRPGVGFPPQDQIHLAQNEITVTFCLISSTGTQTTYEQAGHYNLKYWNPNGVPFPRWEDTNINSTGTGTIKIYPNTDETKLRFRPLSDGDTNPFEAVQILLLSAQETNGSVTYPIGWSRSFRFINMDKSLCP